MVHGKWYQQKTNDKGEVVKYKARLTAKGYSQEYGIDYNETYSPVINTTSARILLSIITNEDMEAEQSDIDSAFLNGDLDEEIYMEQPEGYDFGTGNVLKLIKSLYGLKQAAKCWNRKFDQIMKMNNFKKCITDQCIYTKVQHQGSKIIVGVHVDDLIIASSNSNGIHETKEAIKKFVNIKELGKLHFLLGIKITRDRKTLSMKLDQSLYTANILKRFGMDTASQVLTPVSIAKSNYPDEDKPTDLKLYQSMVGSLMYLMIWTRPDISLAVNLLARKLQAPTTQDMLSAKRLFRYLKGTINLGIIFKKSKENQLYGYSDASWADAGDRKSTTGFIWFYANGPIMWKSQKQKIVALSTCEAEYIAASASAKEGMWIIRLINEITPIKSVPVMYMDNMSAINIASGSAASDRTKHIDLRVHYLKQLVEENQLLIKFIKTQFMLADVLTKAVPRQLLLQFILSSNIK
jgi:hypothetical protein